MRIASPAPEPSAKDLDRLRNVDGVEIASVISRRASRPPEVAAKYGAAIRARASEALAPRRRRRGDPVHADSDDAEQAMPHGRGKHVQVEIPLSDSWPVRSV